jgi:hypothetical protein
LAGDAHQSLLQAGALKVVTCNTISHPTNAIEVSGLLADAVGRNFGLSRPQVVEVSR